MTKEKQELEALRAKKIDLEDYNKFLNAQSKGLAVRLGRLRAASKQLENSNSKLINSYFIMEDAFTQLREGLEAILNDGIVSRQVREGKPTNMMYNIGHHDACEHFWRKIRDLLEKPNG